MGKRGRKKGSDGERSRSLLLEIAAEEFAKNGYHETKISSIVKKADVTQPTFYLYFKSKEAIFQEIIDLFQNKLVELTNHSLLESGMHVGSIEEEITKRLTSFFVFFKENSNITRIGFYMDTGSAEIKIQLAKQIAENLRKEQRDGYFLANIDMEIVAESLVGIMERLTLTMLLEGLISPENLATKIVTLMLYGLVVPA